MTDLATLLTAIGGLVTAVLGSIATLVIALRRVSPKEREDAVTATATDTEQDARITALQAELAELRRRPPTEET